jgi:glycosyltransferase involved in cell wall biosynthesis
MIPKTESVTTLLIVRGDLRSSTGYSRALRDLLSLLLKRFEKVVGSDIHYHPAISVQSCPFPILSDDEVAALAKESGGRALVLHFTSPDSFRPIPGCKNIGYFFWETDRFLPDSHWLTFINQMDEMWLPSHFQSSMLRKSGYKGVLKVVPWPHFEKQATASEFGSVSLIPFALSSTSKRTALSRLGVFLGKQRVRNLDEKIFSRFRISLSDLILKYPNRVLNVAQNVPRKGLVLQLAEWCDFIKAHPDFKGCLIIKTSSLDVGRSQNEIEVEFSETLFRLCRARGLANPHVYLAADRLSESQLDAMFRAATLYSTHTFGEGFGGPIVEAVNRGLPVITPRHTSIESFVTPDYPLIMRSRIQSVSFVGQLDCYSVSSMWGVPEVNEWSRCFSKYLAFSELERNECVEALRKSIIEFCSPEAAEAALNVALGVPVGDHG